VIRAIVLAAVLAAPAPPAGAPVPGPAASPPAPSRAGAPDPSPVGAPQEAVHLAEAPPEWSPAIRKAEGAARDFQQALQSRLAGALSRGGPAAAVDVCAEDAQRIGAETAAAAGVKLGRTSDRLRNPASAAPAWARAFVLLSAGERADDVKGIAVDLGAHLGVLLPIGVKGACLGCHGRPAAMSPEVNTVLARRYPADQAVGYREGDHRGFVWVEVRK
jgi:hypothetical protein